METRNVFLDTQIFRARNFSYTGRELEKLRELGSSGEIRLFLAEITYREIQKKIRDRAREAEKAVKGIVASGKKKAKPSAQVSTTGKDRHEGKIQYDAQVLRNVPDLGFQGLFNFDLASVEEALLAQFEKYIQDAHITVIPRGAVDPWAVVDKYFAGVAPFEDREEKKHEFPDAFAIAEIAYWCESRQETAYVISGDKGFQQGCQQEPRLLPLPDVASVTALVAEATHASKQQVELAHEWFRAARNVIVDRIAREFESRGFILMDEEGEVSAVMVDEGAVELSEPHLLEVSEGYAEFALEAEIPFDADVTYDDPGATVYDEGDRFVFNTIDRTVEVSRTADVYVELCFGAEPPSEDLSEEQLQAVVERITLDVGDVSVSLFDPMEYR